MARQSSAPSFVVLALCVFGFAAACGDSTSGPEAPPAVDRLTIEPGAAVVLLPEQTTQLTATPRSADGGALGNRPVTWSSSDGTVASVSPQGLVTAVAPGQAMVTATSEGVQASLDVEVIPVPVAEVVLEPGEPGPLVPAQTVQLTAATLDSIGGALADRPVEFASSDVEVAEVDATGLVTARAAGVSRRTE